MSGKMPEITAAGNGGGREAFQEHFIHEYLIALTNKHRLCVAIRRINHRNPVCTAAPDSACRRCLQYRHRYPQYKGVPVLHLLSFTAHMLFQVIICINLNLILSAGSLTLVFQFSDGMCYFIADIRYGRPHFSQDKWQTGINLRPQLLKPRWVFVLSPEKDPDSLMHHHSADRQPPRMPICQRCSHCERKNNE